MFRPNTKHKMRQIRWRPAVGAGRNGEFVYQTKFYIVTRGVLRVRRMRIWYCKCYLRDALMHINTVEGIEKPEKRLPFSSKYLNSYLGFAFWSNVFCVCVFVGCWTWNYSTVHVNTKHNYLFEICSFGVTRCRAAWQQRRPLLNKTFNLILFVSDISYVMCAINDSGQSKGKWIYLIRNICTEKKKRNRTFDIKLIQFSIVGCVWLEEQYFDQHDSRACPLSHIHIDFP